MKSFKISQESMQRCLELAKQEGLLPAPKTIGESEATRIRRYWRNQRSESRS